MSKIKDNGKNSFVFYDSFLSAMKHLNDSEFRECVMRIRDYALEGIDEVIQSPYVNIILAMAKPNLDSARRRYMASAENGKKGFSSSFSNSSNSVLINEANDSERLKEKEERKEPPTEEQPSHSNTSVVGVATWRRLKTHYIPKIVLLVPLRSTLVLLGRQGVPPPDPAAVR